MICAPTNTGKSFIAQKLLIHYLEQQELGSASVYLCPFKALAEEVALSLTEKIRTRIQEVANTGELSQFQNPIWKEMPVLSTGDYAAVVRSGILQGKFHLFFSFSSRLCDSHSVL